MDVVYIWDNEEMYIIVLKTINIGTIICRKVVYQYLWIDYLINHLISMEVESIIFK